jgi:hypothetical protein
MKDQDAEDATHGSPRYYRPMHNPPPLTEDDEAEGQALAAAIAASDADPRTAPHEAVRAWLLKLAKGEIGAPPPKAD